MEDKAEENSKLVEKISKNYLEIEREKEQNFVNLYIEMIVSITLKEFYEKGD